MKIYTGGTFDLFHKGHVNFLKKCKRFGGKVIVALNTDEFIQEYKGKPPVMTYEERKEALLGCRYVDEVIENIGGADSKPAIESVMPDIVAIGTDWARKDYYKQMQFTQDWLDEKDITLAYIPYTANVSSTDIKQRMMPSKPILTVAILGHDNPGHILIQMESMSKQTIASQCEFLIYYSGMETAIFTGSRPNTFLFRQPDRNDWGQEKTANALNAARGKYFIAVNMDDYYEPEALEKYVEVMEAGKLDLGYADYENKEGQTVLGEPTINRATRGALIVRSEFARIVGYNHRDYGADGRFAEDLVNAGAVHGRIPTVYYHHR